MRRSPSAGSGALSPTRHDSFVHSNVSSISGSDRVPSSTPPKSNASSVRFGDSKVFTERGRSRRAKSTAAPIDALINLKKAEEPSAFRRLVSVRAIAAAMCFMLLVATATIVLVVTSTFSLEAAQEIASKHALSITNKAKSDIEDFLNVPVRYIKGWQYVLSREDHAFPRDETDPKWIVPWFQRLIEPMASTNFGFQYSVMGFNDGNALVVLPLANERFRNQFYEWGNRNISDPTQQSNLTNTDYHRSNYTVATVAKSTTAYDPRTRSWYTSCPTTPMALKWSSVFLSTVPTLPVINVAAPIHNATGTFLGVATIIFDLTTIGVFLGHLDKTPNTMTFLIDNDGLLVSSSFNQPLLVSTPVSSNFTGTVASNCLRSDVANGAAENVIVCRQKADQYGYKPLRELIQKEPAYVASGRAGSTSVFTLDSKRYYVAVVPIETPQATGMGWRFALFLPEDDIIGGIVKGRNIAIYICIGVVAVAVITALVVITLLLRPLDAVAERMYRVAMMQDVDEEQDDDDNEASASAKTAPTTSSLYEVATIQTAFNTMTAELAKIKSFLPQSVLAQLYGSISDEEGDLQVSKSLCASTVQLSEGNCRSASNSVSVLDTSISKNPSSSGAGNSTGNPRTQVVGLNTSVKLTTRKVTMLCLNILNFHKQAQRRSTEDLVRQHAKIVKAVSDACTEFRGVMDGFQGDRFTISFNAVTHAGSHAVLAAEAARAVRESVSSRVHLKMTSGLASGAAMVGNMGSASTKRFTVVGSVVSSAVLLERLSKRYSSSSDPATLVAGSALQDIELAFDTLTVDALVLPYANGVKRTRVCAVMAPRKASADEWMYEVHESDKNSQYMLVNEAFRLFMEGEVSEAQESVASQLQATSSRPADTASDQVGRVLQFLEELAERANAHPLGASEYGRTYVNTLHDYYSRCALPTTNDATMEDLG